MTILITIETNNERDIESKIAKIIYNALEAIQKLDRNATVEAMQKFENGNNVHYTL